MVQLFYTTYISVDLAHQVTFHAKVGKGGINVVKATFNVKERVRLVPVLKTIYHQSAILYTCS